MWRSDFYINVSAKDREQDLNLNQFKLQVNDTYKEDEKITTFFDDADVINKAHIDEKLSKLGGQTSYMEKDNNFKLHNKEKNKSG